jgi:hypothetical protein
MSEKDLGEIFVPEEWKLFTFFNRQTNLRIHNATVPLTKNGDPYIILPTYTGWHLKQAKGLAEFVKGTSTKFNLFGNDAPLQLKLKPIYPMRARVTVLQIRK